MKTFKSIPDLEQLRGNPLYATVKKLIVPVIAEYPDYQPQDDGYFVLMEREDVDRILDDLDMPWRLSEVPFEAVTMIDRCFHAVWIPNNQFALSILMPDEEWLPSQTYRLILYKNFLKDGKRPETDITAFTRIDTDQLPER